MRYEIPARIAPGAGEMLSTKDISVKEVAISCGFNDESYFIKTFSKYKGITPKQFMKLHF